MGWHGAAALAAAQLPCETLSQLLGKESRFWLGCHWATRLHRESYGAAPRQRCAAHVPAQCLSPQSLARSPHPAHPAETKGTGTGGYRTSWVNGPPQAGRWECYHADAGKSRLLVTDAPQGTDHGAQHTCNVDLGDAVVRESRPQRKPAVLRRTRTGRFPEINRPPRFDPRDTPCRAAHSAPVTGRGRRPPCIFMEPVRFTPRSRSM